MAFVFALLASAVTGCSEGTTGPNGAGGTGGDGGDGGGSGGGGDGGAGGVAWAQLIGGDLPDQGRGLATLPDGAFLVTGSFQGTVSFGKGSEAETELVSAGAADVFVARYEANGELVWARRAGGVGIDFGLEIASFADGSSVVSGHFQQTAPFGQGDDNETTLTSAGAEDIFVARYNADGTLSWAKRAGGVEYETCRGVTSFTDGTSVVAGHFRAMATFGQGEPNETILSSAANVEGIGDIFVARYGADGALLWAKRAGGDSSDIANDVQGLADGSSIVGGRFEGVATFGEAATGETMLTSAGEADAFMARYDANGALSWVKRAGGIGLDQVWGVATYDDGSSVATGSFPDVATFGPGEANETELANPADGLNVFMARYNPDGTLAWAKRGGGDTTTVGRDIEILADGSCVATGRFDGTATFGPGEPRETILTSADASDVFIVRYEPSGDLRWATRAGGLESDSGDAVGGLMDASIIVTGLSLGTATFFPDTADETTLESNGDRDIFIARYPADPM